MTPRQLQIVEYVAGYTAERGVAPTLDEIAAHFGISKNTVFGHVDSLVSQGKLTRVKHRARSLRVAEDRTVAAVKIIRDVADRMSNAEDAGSCGGRRRW